MYHMRYENACYPLKLAISYYIQYMNFLEAGTLIRDVRKKAHLTQDTLARRLKMSRATLSQIENGVIAELGIRKVSQVCDLLGLELTLRHRRPPTLNESYEKNRQERREAFRVTDLALAHLKPDSRA
jgi:transcriptional regulator with XRE-family HTH domain